MVDIQTGNWSDLLLAGATMSTGEFCKGDTIWVVPWHHKIDGQWKQTTVTRDFMTFQDGNWQRYGIRQGLASYAVTLEGSQRSTTLKNNNGMDEK